MATVACLGALVALVAQSTLVATGFLVAMVGAAFSIEAVYRHHTRRHPDIATTS